ncbi:MAG: NosD domain-containing protein [Actinomycetota bacterium]|nr:NosD domain-containing protein [Actinomycetota bacterium]
MPLIPLEVNPYLADDPLGLPEIPLEPQIPGRLESTGIRFCLTDSEYLNISLDSSEPVKLVLESVPEMVAMQLEAASGAGSTSVTLGGFVPLTTYHKYEDDYRNHVAFTTDENGNYFYIQDLSKAHSVFIQPRPSTIFLSDSGWSRDGIGTWDPVTKTATLTSDVFETIQIDSDGITLDGNGHTVTGSGSGSGIYLHGRTGVTVKNATVKGFYIGILLDHSNNNAIVDNVASSNAYGIRVNCSYKNALSGNVQEVNAYTGLTLQYQSSSNTVSNNNAVRNGAWGVFISQSDSCIVEDSSASLNRDGGFYFGASTYSTLTDCISESNRQHGLFLSTMVYGTLSRNTISRNGCGISTLYSAYNKIYNNNFVANGTQSVGVDGWPQSNGFNIGKPSGGNYWSNWTGPDGNGDGFVDKPYYVGRCADYLPWTKPNGWGSNSSDKTAPATIIELFGTPGDNGWYLSDVKVGLTSVDNEGGSGVAKTEYNLDGVNWINCTAPFTISVDGRTTVHYRSTDKAGNVGAVKEQQIGVDKTAPIIDISIPADGGEYSLGENVLAEWTAMDSISGLVLATGTVPSGAPIDTSIVGAHTFTVEATDNAGNHSVKTVTYFVRYEDFRFLPPNTSSAKFGSTIPVKFQIKDASGNFIKDAVAKIYAAKIENGVPGVELEGIPSGSANSGNLFRYDSDGERYIFNLSTKNLSVGTWRVRVELNDGSSKYLETTLR